VKFDLLLTYSLDYLVRLRNPACWSLMYASVRRRFSLSETPQRQNAPDGKELLLRLNAMEGQPGSFTSLMMVSIGMLPLSMATDEFWNDFAATLWDYQKTQQGELYELSQSDWMILLKMTEFNQVKLVSDLKVRILRLIQTYFPENFGSIDQSRLIRSIDLRIRLTNAINFVVRHEERKNLNESGAPMRRLQLEDIEKVIHVSKELGAKKFAEIFIRHQKIALINPDQPPTDVLHEYYVGMDALKKHVFTRVDLRGAGNVFNQLTLALDRLILDGFEDLNPSRAKCSINLNVETVFTPSFEKFLGDSDDQTFSNIIFEFRQDNILQNYDEFSVASELIRSKNGTIAIDAIFPETVGIVNLNRLGASIAKVFWRNGAEAILPKFKKDIVEVQAGGTMVVLARVDDENAIQIGHDLGVAMFQGFYIDRLLQS